MKTTFRTLLVAIVAMGIMGCGNYDYDIAIDHASHIAGNYYLSGEGKWFDSHNPSIVFPETYLSIEKEGMGISIKVFEDRKSNIIADSFSFTYNELADGMTQYKVGNTPMRKYNLNRGGISLTITIGTNNLYEGVPTIVYKSPIILFNGMRAHVGPTGNGIAYLKPVEEFRELLNSIVSNKTIERIVFDAGVSEELPEGAIIVSEEPEDKDYKPAWIMVVGNTLRIRTNANEFYANEDCSSMFSGLNTVKTIDFCNRFNTSNVKYMRFMFSFSSVETLHLSGFDTSNVEDFFGMFAYCSSLTNLNVSSFDTSNVTDMNGMFEGCTALETLDLSNFNTSKVEDIYYMFKECSSLKTIYLSNFDGSSLLNAGGMFEKCSSLRNIDLSKFNTSKLQNASDMFSNCNSLKNLDLSNFDTKKIESVYSMFKNCISLTTITLGPKFVLPNNLEGISTTFTFTNCKNLTTINYSNPETKTSIQAYGFFTAPNDGVWYYIGE